MQARREPHANLDTGRKYEDSSLTSDNARRLSGRRAEVTEVILSTAFQHQAGIRHGTGRCQSAEWNQKQEEGGTLEPGLLCMLAELGRVAAASSEGSLAACMLMVSALCMLFIFVGCLPPEASMLFKSCCCCIKRPCGTNRCQPQA